MIGIKKLSVLPEPVPDSTSVFSGAWWGERISRSMARRWWVNSSSKPQGSPRVAAASWSVSESMRGPSVPGRASATNGSAQSRRESMSSSRAWSRAGSRKGKLDRM